MDVWGGVATYIYRVKRDADILYAGFGVEVLREENEEVEVVTISYSDGEDIPPLLRVRITLPTRVIEELTVRNISELFTEREQIDYLFSERFTSGEVIALMALAQKYDRKEYQLQETISEQQVRRMEFVKWMIQGGRISEQ